VNRNSARYISDTVVSYTAPIACAPYLVDE